MEAGYTICQAKSDDLEELIQLERKCFTPEEAASKEAFQYRLEHYPQWFFQVEKEGKIIAHCDGCVSKEPYIKEEMYQAGNEYGSEGKNLLIFGLVVHPEFQMRGIAAELLEYVVRTATERKLETVAFTCRERLISYYERLGFTKMGVSESVHGGIKWFNMRKIL